MLKENMKKKPNEKLRLALSQYQETWLQNFPTDDELAGVTFSHTFEKKMDKLIKRRKKSYYALINTSSKRVAAIALTVLVAFFGTVFSVKSLREPFINFIMEVYEKFSVVRFHNGTIDTTGDLTKIEKFYTPKYIPKGYTLDSELKSVHVCKYIYHNDEGKVMQYNQGIFSASTTIAIDTEGTTTQNVQINGYTGIFFSNKGYNNIIWNDGFYIFDISVPVEIGKEELLKIGESLS